jgi:hypothetical protein
MMTKLLFILIFTINLAWASCYKNYDLVILGDSQIGATWSKSYVGNYLQKCLQKNSAQDFIILGRGGTHLGHWINKTNMDHIETIERTHLDNHKNLGNTNLPLCQKRLHEALAAYKPRKLVLSFGGNWIGHSESVIKQDLKNTIAILAKNQISKDQCYFITPTFEMQVDQRRNVPSRNLEAVKLVTKVIDEMMVNTCQVISGIELMQDSPLLENQILKRQSITGDAGCMGAAVNDNVHICGMAALELANKICEKIW